MRAKFVNLLVGKKGNVKLTLNFEDDDYLTVVYFKINELRDWLYGLNTNIDKEDEIIDIRISTYKTNDRKINTCLEITTQNGYKEYLYEDDDFFFKDFLKL